jgi:hypothetical protein
MGINDAKVIYNGRVSFGGMRTVDAEIQLNSQRKKRDFRTRGTI